MHTDNLSVIVHRQSNTFCYKSVKVLLANKTADQLEISRSLYLYHTVSDMV